MIHTMKTGNASFDVEDTDLTKANKLNALNCAMLTQMVTLKEMKTSKEYLYRP